MNWNGEIWAVRVAIWWYIKRQTDSIYQTQATSNLRKRYFERYKISIVIRKPYDFDVWQCADEEFIPLCKSFTFLIWLLSKLHKKISSEFASSWKSEIWQMQRFLKTKWLGYPSESGSFRLVQYGCNQENFHSEFQSQKWNYRGGNPPKLNCHLGRTLID